MLTKRQLFHKNVGLTSDMPMAFEVSRASGVIIYDGDGNPYFDMNSGIAVSSVGHCHPKVVAAIQKQAELYLHTMVYGEHIQSPQVEFADLLLSFLPEQFSSLYYLMAGTEATELAIKLAKKHTGRYNIVACHHSYHGSTHGSESLRSDEEYVNNFRPLLPGISHVTFNNLEDLDKITEQTAGFIMEVVRGEAGVELPDKSYLQAVREKCTKTGTLLIFDEIQSGFGRTGHLFAFQKYRVLPDIFTIGKAMGGGMPLAGVITSQSIMSSISSNPILGHITTFGGHSVSCAAALASLQTLLAENLITQVDQKATQLKDKLNHPIVKKIRNWGLMMAVQLIDPKYLMPVVQAAQDKGVFIDWFLFNDDSFRLAPPLIISMEEIDTATKKLQEAFDCVLSS